MGTVLVIEDDHDTRVGLRSALEDEGYTVFSATNGEQGFALLQQLQGSVIVVLDQNMPLGSGDEFLRLKNQHPQLQQLAVIVISAVSNRLFPPGPTAYLRKPFELESLIHLIRGFSPTQFLSAEAG